MNDNNISEKIINISLYDNGQGFWAEIINLSNKMIFNINSKVENSDHPLPIAFFLFNKPEPENELINSIVFNSNILDLKQFKIIIV